MKVAALVITTLALVACADTPSSTLSPTAVPIATPLPPQFQPRSQLAGRLRLDFGLGSIWTVTLRDGAVTEAVTSDSVIPTQASVPLSG